MVRALPPACRNRLGRLARWTAATAVALVAIGATARAAQQPNILYIMSDDHTANAISAYGSMWSDLCKTPNIDRLAKEGMRLENCLCTNSICTPSRVKLMTGLSNVRNYSAFSILKRPLGPGSVVLGGLTLIFLGLGGIAYMAGTVFYAWEKLPYHHAIWHLFVVAGSTMHFFSIYHAVIPKSV